MTIQQTVTSTPGSVITFLRKRDYVFVKVLGQGACGQTVLLRDEVIGSDFVCKKYLPFDESYREELFKGFLREIKLLHEVHHLNVVRVFNYYVFPEQFTGYILMEFVNGTDIEEHLRAKPENVTTLFIQAVEGFAYLESQSILHRDIRPLNIMVTDDGTLKIIDLGFGKRIETQSDYDKSISLNWWCDPPSDFSMGIYNHATEVYFLGKLFEKLVVELNLEDFKYKNLLASMCSYNSIDRISSFMDVRAEIDRQGASDVDFIGYERSAYLTFANGITKHLKRIEAASKYRDDLTAIRNQLETLYRNCMLEEHLPDSSSLISIFLRGGYSFMKVGYPTTALKGFLDLLRSSSLAKQRIILANLHGRLDAVTRYQSDEDDDIPF
jgi:serine/threonine protein kinase